MRGQAQIQAAARDDQATANRNGDKPEWERVNLGDWLNKLDEEYHEFKERVMQGDMEGMRWEGSDLRICVTGIQTQQAVLEIEEPPTALPLESRVLVPAQMVVGLGVVGYGAARVLLSLWRGRKRKEVS